MQVGHSLRRLIGLFCRTVGMSVGIAILGIALLVAWSVFSREALQMSDSGVNDIAGLLMGYITFVGAGYLLWEGGHIGVDLLTERLTGLSATAVKVLAHTIIIAVCGAFAWLSFEFWLEAWHTGETSWGTFPVPLWIPYLSMSLGSTMLLLVQVARIALPAVPPLDPSAEG